MFFCVTNYLSLEDSAPHQQTDKEQLDCREQISICVCEKVKCKKIFQLNCFEEEEAAKPASQNTS